MDQQQNYDEQNRQEHGLTSDEARQAGLPDEKLQPGKDYKVDKGRDMTNPATQQIEGQTGVNDDDISQRDGYQEKI
ncbi:MAG TPA: hypothetical protein VH186_21790 [Chloroflexia bacterium]|nr:hypothetical protein [Chloroflexia bacterium]